MLAEFFFKLREAQIPVSLTEHLALMEALLARVAEYQVEDFYFLARAVLIKDERHFDRFDRVFGAYFKGLEELFAALEQEPIPEDWLRRQAELLLSDEEKAQVEAQGGWDELMARLRRRLAEQKSRHAGGNKWIGTAGTSPFGAFGYNPRGVRMGRDESGQRRAVKVWDRREYSNLDDDVQLGTRNLQAALRKLRRFARQGAAEELDLDGTINATARNAGWLDLKMVPERHNAVKVLLLVDVGGSMNPFVRVCEALFSAARSEFKNLEYFYFHNFFYDYLWRDNRGRQSKKTGLPELIRTYPKDHKVIIVGDATMSPYEITMPGGNVDYWNAEPGQVWAQRLFDAYPSIAWLNPVPREHWTYTPSIALVQELLSGRMFPLTPAGLDEAILSLKGKHAMH